MDERIRLVLETLGVDNVRQATRALRDIAEATDSFEGELAQLSRTVREGVEADMERFLVTLKDGRKVWNDSAEGIRQLGEAAGKAAGGTSGGRGIRNIQGQNLLALSYAVDDLQYGFRAIINNIPQIVQAFGFGAGAAGAVSIAVIGINTALTLLQNLLGDTEAKLKPFKDVLDDFAKGMGASNLETQKLNAEIEKLAKQAAPGWFQDITDNLPKIREAIKAQQELAAMQKEDQAEKAKREEFDRRVEQERLDKEKAGQVGDALAGVGPDGQVGLAQRLARDKMGKARGELMDDQLAMMEAAGNFGDIRDPLFGMAVPFLNRGGTQLFSSGAKRRAEERRAAAKTKLETDMSFDNEEVRKRAESIAGGTIEKARAGDPRAIAEVEAISPEVADLIRFDAEDKAFQASLSDRSKAVAERNERRAKKDAELGKSMQALFRGQDSDAAIREGRAARGARRPAIEDFERAPVRPDRDPEAEAKAAQEAAIRNQVLGMADPAAMAAARMFQAAQAGPRRNQVMQQLEKRDRAMFASALMERGMAPGAADEAAAQSIAGGSDTFADFAALTGKSLKNNQRALEASVLFIQKQRADIEQIQMQQEMILQQLNLMNGNDRQQARPPARVRN